MIWVEFLLLLTCILVGFRVGGVGLGAVAGLGLFIMVFVFRQPPVQPPVVVTSMIVAVVSAAASMQAAGGLDYLVALADRVLRKNPRAVIFVAPFLSYVFTLFSGSSHIVYALLPVIAEMSRKEGVRPERPISASVIASHLAITASPFSAAVVMLVATLAPAEVTFLQVVAIAIPSTLIGAFAAALSVWRKGPELVDDPVYQQRLEQGRFTGVEQARKLEGAELTRARGSVILFAGAALAIVVFGLFPALRPQFPGAEGEELTRLGMAQVIALLMLCVAGLNFLVFGARAEVAVKGTIARAGVVAVVSILGISWLTTCFFEGNRDEILSAMTGMITAYPILFSVALFTLSALLYSQAATALALMPAGLALGLPAPILIAMWPAANGLFFLPAYSVEVSAMSFDQTGTTRVGRFLINHSFMRPGLVGVIVSVAVGLLLAGILH